MTDNEISKALALAIGWPIVDVYTWGIVVRERGDFAYKAWRIFDYRDTAYQAIVDAPDGKSN